ncbi:MAG: amino acid ABC transporter substrate-binding protein [Rhodobacter sp.]|jgi:ABC-type amino acid transport substrate-binding protein|nr:amino acid ABC transporter substrate-binding protein [Rhodobacter sp.]MBK8440156.1 amino acid ABC transporter substrate-binding protein [Rhodobacter sp.]
MACLASVSALGVALVLASGGDDHLTIGTEVPFPPYLVQAEDGALSGFDHDVMAEVCTRAAFDCDWQLATFDELIPGVMEGRFDVVLGGMAITPERLEKVDFTDPYHFADDTEWFIGPPGAPVPDRARTAVQAGTLHEAFLRQEGHDFRAYPTETAALRALTEGGADLAFGPFENRPDLAGLFAAGGFQLLYDVHLADEGTAIAVCKGNDALRTRLNGALQAMFDDGTMQILETRWF